MISTDDLNWLLSDFDLGTSTAENDPLLESAKIETQQFHDLYWHDRIDIVKGIKGSGKTAIYRLFFLLREYVIRKNNLYCVFGVEPTGDPIFRLYQAEFEKFSEIEFENFWSVYFIALVYNLIYTTPQLKIILTKDLQKIDDILENLGLKFTKNGYSLKESIGAIQKFFQNNKIKFGLETNLDTATAQIKSVSPVIEIDSKNVEDISRRPIYLASFRDQLADILGKNKIKIWVMLDRLDEVFPHRSEVEKIGLRGLLKASYNFSHPNLRTKIF
ncbi:MAG: hypothetical protein ABSC11_14775, partial [Smithella sp.]